MFVGSARRKRQLLDAYRGRLSDDAVRCADAAGACYTLPALAVTCVLVDHAEMDAPKFAKCLSCSTPAPARVYIVGSDADRQRVLLSTPMPPASSSTIGAFVDMLVRDLAGTGSA